MINRIVRGFDHLTTQYPDDDHIKNRLERVADRCLLLTDTIACFAKEKLLGQTGYAYLPRSLKRSRLSYVVWMACDIVLFPFLAPIGLIARLFAASRQEGHKNAAGREAGTWYTNHLKNFEPPTPASLNHLAKAPTLVKEHYGKDILSKWIKKCLSLDTLPSFLKCQQQLPLTPQERTGLLHSVTAALGERLEEPTYKSLFTAAEWTIDQKIIDQAVKQALNTAKRQRVGKEIRYALEKYDERLLAAIAVDPEDLIQQELLQNAWAYVIQSNLLNELDNPIPSQLSNAKARYARYKGYLQPDEKAYLDGLIRQKEWNLVHSLMEKDLPNAVKVLRGIHIADVRYAIELTPDQRLLRTEYDLLVQQVIYHVAFSSKEPTDELLCLIIDDKVQEETKNSLTEQEQALKLIQSIDEARERAKGKVRAILDAHGEHKERILHDTLLQKSELRSFLEAVDIPLPPETSEDLTEEFPTESAQLMEQLGEAQRAYRAETEERYVSYLKTASAINAFLSVLMTEQGKKNFYRNPWIVTSIVQNSPDFMKFVSAGLGGQTIAFLEKADASPSAQALLKTLTAQVNEFIDTENRFQKDLETIIAHLNETKDALAGSSSFIPRTKEQKDVQARIHTLDEKEKSSLTQQIERSLKSIARFKFQVTQFKTRYESAPSPAHAASSSAQRPSVFFSPVSSSKNIPHRVGGLLLYHFIYDSLSHLTAFYSPLYQKLAVGRLITGEVSAELSKIVQRGPRYVMLLNEIHRSFEKAGPLLTSAKDDYLLESNRNVCTALHLSLVFLKWYMIRANYELILQEKSTSDKK